MGAWHWTNMIVSVCRYVLRLFVGRLCLCAAFSVHPSIRRRREHGRRRCELAELRPPLVAAPPQGDPGRWPPATARAAVALCSALRRSVFGAWVGGCGLRHGMRLASVRWSHQFFRSDSHEGKIRRTSLRFASAMERCVARKLEGTRSWTESMTWATKNRVEEARPLFMKLPSDCTLEVLLPA